jgi:hypothetical protein
MSAPPQAVAPNPHTSLLNVYIQMANKMGFQQKNYIFRFNETLFYKYSFSLTVAITDH